MNTININTQLAQRLIAAQFPQWRHLAVRPVVMSGWDNRTFHLGEEMLVRMPSAEHYASQVEKEHLWLPKLAPFLPVRISEPLAMGRPGEGYPWKWSIYRWLEGHAAVSAPIENINQFAKDLAQFLLALQSIPAMAGPLPGAHCFYRGGDLSIYDEETRKAITLLAGKVDVVAATKVWDAALETTWQKSPVWVHGDVSMGNLLVHNGRLCAVIDFGQLTLGDPACDLAIAWNFFQGESREVFRNTLALDKNTWARARGWTLWKALIVVAGITEANSSESDQWWRIIHDVLAEHEC